MDTDGVMGETRRSFFRGVFGFARGFFHQLRWQSLCLAGEEVFGICPRRGILRRVSLPGMNMHGDRKLISLTLTGSQCRAGRIPVACWTEGSPWFSGHAKPPVRETLYPNAGKSCASLSKRKINLLTHILGLHRETACISLDSLGAGGYSPAALAMGAPGPPTSPS